MSEHFTKQRIFDAAEELMLQKSFQSVSLNEILKATDTPKGCFYHHFASKEAFGAELIKHYTDETLAHYSELLLNQKMEPNARLRILTHYEAGIAKFIENGGKCPCLLIKLAAETGFSSPAMREQISQGYHSIGQLYEQVIQEGLDNPWQWFLLSGLSPSALFCIGSPFPRNSIELFSHLCN